MRLADLRLYHVKPRYLLVRLETDNGLVGWGEATLEGRSRTTATAVTELFETIRDEDPRRIEHIWQRMYRGGFYRGGAVLCSAMSGIEQALWDILGKALHAPVYQLLGGAVRDRIRLYHGIWSSTAEDAVRDLCNLRARGFTAFKVNPWQATGIVDHPSKIEYAVGIVSALREAGGSDVDIALDGHGRLSPAMAIQFARALEPYRPMFLEEPCLPENIDTMVRVAQSTCIPIATGERLFTKWGYREVLEKQAAAILQPDVSHCGGIFEARKIAAMAELYYAGVAPHCPLSAVALAACVQLAACAPNFVIQEHVSLGEDLLVEPFVPKDGYLELPTGAGLGIEVDERKLAALAYDGAWQSPELRHEDGSVADW